VLLETSGVALSVYSLSDSTNASSPSELLAEYVDASSSEANPPSSQLLPMLPCIRRDRALMFDNDKQ
jgi:hypothetical protein